MPNRAICVLLAVFAAVGLAASSANAEFVPGGTVDLGSEFLQRTDGAAPGDLLAYEGSAAGAGAASAGDVNGDGVPDLIFGSYGADNNGRSNSGSAYIRFGPVTPGIVSLADPAAPPGIRIDGASPGEQAGWAVNAAGDFNGDGLGDVLVGAPSVGGSSLLGGAAYIVFGRTTPGTIDLASLGSAGVVLRGQGDVFGEGNSVNSAGDVNGDEIADVIIGAASSAPKARSGAGSAFVIYGTRTPPASIDLANIQPSQGFRIDGPAASGNTGGSVSGAGDINGDGFDDVLVGVPSIDGTYPTGPSGRVYLVFGGRGYLDLDSFGATDGVRINGPTGYSTAGYQVSRGGDLNADGVPDLLIGAPAASARSDYIVFGEPSLPATIELGSLVSDGRGTQMKGAFGPIVRAGDVNGDGVADVIVGSAIQNARGAATGAAFVVFGGFGAELLDLASLGERGVRINGATATSYTGQAVAGVGNIDGTGADDVLVGAFGTGYNGSNSGSAYIVNPQPANLRAEKIAAPEEASPGDIVYFTIAAINDGPGGATKVQSVDTLPPGFVVQAIKPSQGTCEDPVGSVLRCDLGTIAAGAGAIVVVRGAIAASASGTLRNTVTVSGPSGEGPSAEASVRIKPGGGGGDSKLVVEKTADQSVAYVGEPLGYTVTIRNSGTKASDDLILVDIFSAKVKVVEATLPGGSCRVIRLILCRGQPLAPGKSVEARVVAIPLSVGELGNAAAAIGDLASVSLPIPEKAVLLGLPNIDLRKVKVKPERPRLKLKLTPPKRVSVAGATVPYRLAVSARRHEALNVKVCDWPQAGLHIVEAPGGELRGPSVCWHFKKLPLGATRVFHLRARIDPGFPGGRLVDRATAVATEARARPARALIFVPGGPSCRVAETDPVATASC